MNTNDKPDLITDFFSTKKKIDDNISYFYKLSQGFYVTGNMHTAKILI